MLPVLLSSDRQTSLRGIAPPDSPLPSCGGFVWLGGASLFVWLSMGQLRGYALILFMAFDGCESRLGEEPPVSMVAHRSPSSVHSQGERLSIVPIISRVRDMLDTILFTHPNLYGEQMGTMEVASPRPSGRAACRQGVAALTWLFTSGTAYRCYGRKAARNYIYIYFFPLRGMPRNSWQPSVIGLYGDAREVFPVGFLRRAIAPTDLPQSPPLFACARAKRSSPSPREHG